MATRTAGVYTRRAVLTALAIIACVEPARAGRLRGSVEAGFDSYTEKYSVVEADTLDQLTEFRTRLRLAYVAGDALRSYAQVEGRSLIGEESIETSGALVMRALNGRHRAIFDGEVTRRTFRNNSLYTFANDFTRYGLRIQGERQLSPGLRLRLSDRLEVMDFDRRTEFDQDYVRNQIRAGVQFDAGYTSFYSGSLGYITKSIRDSTEISYRAYAAGLEYRQAWGERNQVLLTASGERRVYNDPLTRSPLWSAFSNLRVQPVSFGPFAIAIDNETEVFTYDEPTHIFFDYVETRSAALIRYFRSFTLSIGAGPTLGFFVSDSSPEDAYEETGAKVVFDLTAGNRVWISAAYEPGYRNYSIDASDNVDIIFSDFAYHRILVFATVTLWSNTSANLFLNHEPENHRIEHDDASATLFSFDIGYSF